MSGSHLDRAELPKNLALGVVAFSLLFPALAVWSPGALRDGLRAIVESTGGATVAHGVIEWTTVLLGLTISLFALARLSVVRDSVTIVIASVLLFTVPLDLVHLVVAWGLWAPGFSDWSWWAARCFAAGALALGLRAASGRGSPRHAERAIDYRIAGASLIVLVIVGWVASGGLGEGAQSPAAWSYRPWEVLPLALFLFGGLSVFPAAHRARPSMQSHAVVLAALPNVICHFQMGLLSRVEFDAHYFSAHLERLLGAVALLVGLAYDYRRTRQDIERAWGERDEEIEGAGAIRDKLDEEIRQRRLVENAQRALHMAVETMTLGVTVVDLEGRIKYVNRADAHMHGFEVDELLGQKARIYGTGDLSKRDPRPGKRVFWEREGFNRKKDGSLLPVRLISDWVTDLEGRTVGQVTLCEDLTHMKVLERTREEFLAEVSHELKTPLTSIIASLGLIASIDEESQPGRVNELTDIAVRNSERLLVLINDLLELQKLKAGAVSFKIEPLDQRMVVERAVSEVDPWAESCAVRLDLEDLRPGARVLADERRLVQVLTNLLSNAIRHTAANRGEWVRLEAGQRAGQAYVSVTDQGKGIPRELIGRVFERFGPEVGVSERIPGGSGLGLSIVHALVTGMNGAIEVESTLGKGSTFRVVLPLAPGPEA